MTPTQRTLKYYRGLGYKIGSVERYVSYAPKDPRRRFRPGQKFDLFGIIDMIAIRKNEIIGVQSTGSAFSSHMKKMTVENRQASLDWIDSGGKLVLIGWRKILKKRGGKLKIWSPRIKEIVKEDVM